MDVLFVQFRCPRILRCDFGDPLRRYNVVSELCSLAGFAIRYQRCHVMNVSSSNVFDDIFDTQPKKWSAK